MGRRKKQAGRPPKIEEAGPIVLGAVETLSTLTDACAAAGIDASTLRLWRKLGREKPASVYGDFSRKFETAKARGKIGLVGATFKNAMKDGNLGLRIMERKWPAEWGRPPEQVEVSGKEGGPVAVQHSADPAIQKMLERFAKMDAERKARQEARSETAPREE